jgi:hypothetical protein
MRTGMRVPEPHRAVIAGRRPAAPGPRSGAKRHRENRACMPGQRLPHRWAHVGVPPPHSAIRAAPVANSAWTPAPLPNTTDVTGPVCRVSRSPGRVSVGHHNRTVPSKSPSASMGPVTRAGAARHRRLFVAGPRHLRHRGAGTIEVPQPHVAVALAGSQQRPAPGPAATERHQDDWLLLSSRSPTGVSA